jgi:hypothetical protein
MNQTIVIQAELKIDPSWLENFQVHSDIINSMRHSVISILESYGMIENIAITPPTVGG